MNSYGFRAVGLFFFTLQLTLSFIISIASIADEQQKEDSAGGQIFIPAHPKDGEFRLSRYSLYGYIVVKSWEKEAGIKVLTR